MASDASFLEYVLEQIDLPHDITYRKMFGEYALYLGGKVVGFICDNQLFIKPTEAGRQVLVRVTEGIPYPRGKPHFRIDAELDDPSLLRRLLLVTADALPAAVSTSKFKTSALARKAGRIR